MKIFTAPDCLPARITVEYTLMTSLTSPGIGMGDEPIAICRVRLAQTLQVAGEECQLVAYHFPGTGRPIAMPVVETGEPVEGEWAGRFLLLPGRDLTLVLVDAHEQTRSLVQLGLQLSERLQGDGGEDGSSLWSVAVEWSDGVEIALCKSWPIYLVTRVRELGLSEAQCSAFLRLGGLLRADIRVVGSAIDTKLICPPGGAEGMEFALHREFLPDGQVSSLAYADMRAAVEQGRIDLGACWVLLPARCPACHSPVLSETARVATLWGWMHPDCVSLGQRPQVVELPPAPAAPRGLPAFSQGESRGGQITFPWAS